MKLNKENGKSNFLLIKNPLKKNQYKNLQIKILN